MSDLEGVYRHDGSALSWDAAGFTVEGPGARTLRLSWLDVRGARQLPGRDDEIQIVVLPRRGRTALDVLDVTVNSIHDAPTGDHDQLERRCPERPATGREVGAPPWTSLRSTA